jgi:hypothetical protein
MVPGPSLAIVLGLLGCAGPGATVEPLPTPPAPSPAPVPGADCTPLSLDASRTEIPPRGFVQLVPGGGTGVWRFEVDPPDLGTVEEATWGFLASSVPGSATVTVTDPACPDAASVSIEVLAPLVASPEAALLAPGDPLTPTWEGGSSEVGCTLEEATTGGALVGCTYTAGPLAGEDRVRVTDDVLGTFHDVRITVDPAAVFQVAGHERVWLPVGTNGSGVWSPRATSGSGVLDVTVLAGPLQSLGTALEATGTGSGEVRVTDRHTGAEAVVPVTAVGPVVPAIPRDGERSGQGTALPLGDVDGDGLGDVAVGFIEPGIDHHYGGAVAVYRGIPGGLDPTPAQVFAGQGVNWTLGRSLAAGDVDGDGALDLLMGADRADVGATNNGVVRIHHGLPGGFFDPVARRLEGEIPFSRFGSALAVCDFDGDGWLDLAAGALEAADLATAVPADDQGAIQVFWGGPNGYSDSPDFDLYGRLPGPSGWVPAAGLGLGTSLAAGDFDGDGLCDLAAGTPDFAVPGSAEQGAVFVFAGRDDGDILSRDPVRWIVGPPSAGSAFGRRLASGDTDGDGRDELLVTAWKDGFDRAGAVYLFDDLVPLVAPDAVAASTAGWIARGSAAFDFFGSDARLDDMNGDGRPDVVVGAYRAQDEDVDQGIVYVFVDPVASGQVVSATAATLEIEGQVAGDRFGQAVAGLGDADFDTFGDVVALAGYSSDQGIQAGKVAFGSGGANAVTTLSLPGVPSGHEVGASLARIDMDGDGVRDVVFGAPDAGVDGVGGNAGRVYWAPMTPTGLGTPVLRVADHPSYSGSDRYGTALAVVDFDGDGFDDLAVVARTDSRTATFPAPYHDPDACGGTAQSLTGSVHVYRGTASGVEDTASFAWFGFDPRGSVERLVGLDHDGDGFGDLVVASQGWEDTGGFAVLHGRAHSGLGLDVLCDEEVVLGNERFDRLGASLASLGDLDGDGCDDVAVGATGEELGRDWNNQGSVRVVWGHGAAGCRPEARVTTLQLEVIGTGLGSGLGAGHDLDGDGIDDLVVGGAEYRVYFAEHGAAWMVPGSWILAAQDQALVGGVLPDDASTVRNELLPNQGLQGTYGLVGREAAGRYGASVGSVRIEGVPHLLVAAPLGAPGGAGRSGGLELHRWDAGWVTPAAQIVVGEGPLEGRLGEVWMGFDDTLVLGAPTSSVEGLEVGAVYLLDL